MANTTNFNWETPDDTDLVKDGAAAIRTLGSAIDTSLVDLKGGTTGQVLSKATNTDMDFTWVAQDDSNAIQNAIVDAKGDIITATANDTPSRLAVGANNTILTADSSTATGLKWAAPASTASSYSLINTGGTTLTGAATITVSGISSMEKLMIVIQGADAGAFASMQIRFNSDSGANYTTSGGYYYAPAAYNATNLGYLGSSGDTKISVGALSSNTASKGYAYLFLDGANSTGIKAFNFSGSADTGGGNGQQWFTGGGVYLGTSTISSVSVISDVGNWAGGTVYIYGSAV